jgi:2-polyprenyl-3-methyl-5-hydroxy-6-metoxy-1,4-benzoquinol methylase
VTARDRERWDARHAVVTEDLPMPPDALRGHETLLPAAGTALDVACGRGAVAVWLAVRGFAVDAVDVSAVGLAAAAAAAAVHGVAGRVRRWRCDLDGGLPAGCPGPYDVIVCQRFREPRLYPELVTRLRPGGLLAITVLSEVGDSGGPWRAAPGELAAAFGELTVLARREGDGEASLLARRP